ncbi:MAG: hypothetical protein P8Y60_13240, partial [Calditrichota bacterium]
MKSYRYLIGIFGIILLGIFFLKLLLSGVDENPESYAVSQVQVRSGKVREGGIAVWQGFEHNWTYNHRLNRLGDYIHIASTNQNKFEVTDTHTAATGIGDDEATYLSYFTFFQVNGVEAIQEQVSFHFQNRQGNPSRQTAQISVPWDKAPEKPRIIAVLNGYDLVTNRSAFKLQTLQISVSNPHYDPVNKQITCRVNATLNMRCRSIECRKFEPDYNYTLQVNVLLLRSGPVMHSVEGHYQQIYNWDRKTEAQVRPVRDELVGTGNNTYPNAVLGFRALSILLNREHWFIDIASAIHPGQYDQRNGSYTFDLTLLFKAWKKGMRRHSADRLDSQFSFREKGSAVLLATVELIQLPAGCVQEKTIPGQISWRERRRNPRSAAAEQSIQTSFGSNCTE